MMCITSKVGETGSSLGDCGALMPVWRLLPVAELAHFCEARTRTTLPGAWVCHVHESTLSQAPLQNFLTFPGFPSPFLFPPSQGGLSDSICSGNSCLNCVKSLNTWRTRRKRHELVPSPFPHLCPVVQCCLFCLLLKRTLSMGAVTPTLNILPYVSSVSALLDEI